MAAVTIAATGGWAAGTFGFLGAAFLAGAALAGAASDIVMRLVVRLRR